MCVIAVLPAGVELTAEELEAMWDSNPDGFGYMYARNGTIHVGKSLTWKDVIPIYRKARKRAAGNLVLHFRWGTHGKRDLANCHPFMVSNRIAVVHNGIIAMKGESFTQSDTSLFVDNVLKRLSGEWWNDPAAIEVLERCVGPSNKMVLLTNEGVIKYINGEGFSQHGKLWVSNKNWLVNYGGDWDYGFSRRPYKKFKWNDRSEYMNDKGEPTPTGTFFCTHCNNSFDASELVTYIEGDLCPLCFGDVLPIHSSEGVEEVDEIMEITDFDMKEPNHARTTIVVSK